MKAVILAGGEGTRLRPLTYNTPKVLIPLLNRPLLSLQLDLLRNHGVKDIVLSVGRTLGEIRRVFGAGEEWGVKIQYALEKEPLGTGGGIRNASPFLDELTIVFNGDVVTDFNLKQIIQYHRKKRARATIVLVPVADPTTYGLVIADRDGRIRRFLEKPGWGEVIGNTISAGIYILGKDLIHQIPPGVNYSVERQFFPSLLAQDIPFYGYEAEGYWLDVGTNERYLQVHKDFLQGNIKIDIPGEKIGGIWRGEGCEIDPHAHLSGPTLIGNFCQIEAGAIISHFTVLGPGCQIKKGAYIEQSVFGEGVVLEEGAHIQNSIVGKKCRVGAYAHLGDGNVLGEFSQIGPYSQL